MSIINSYIVFELYKSLPDEEKQIFDSIYKNHTKNLKRISHQDNVKIPEIYQKENREILITELLNFHNNN